MNCSLFLVLTLGLGIAVLCVVIVMDCIRNIALDLRHIRIPGASGSITSVNPASGDGKNWLWKLLFNNSALSLASQFCVVKWHWEEPQVVGNTMSFTVKVCGYTVSPAVVRVPAHVDAFVLTIHVYSWGHFWYTALWSLKPCISISWFSWS